MDYMRSYLLILAVCFLVSGKLHGSAPLAFPVQDDTVKVPDVIEIPVIDGFGNDACWSLVNWQTIDQVWIPWGTTLPADDFTGRYKVVWSSATNFLYILLEVTDDVYIDGYVYNANPQTGGGYPNYDLPEIFIDENRSKGLHVFDGANSNAENAFSYHIMVNFPSEGMTTSTFVACDIAGTDWLNYFIANYASHFDGFIVRRSSDTTIWEMALKVYGEAYSPSNPEASRIILSEGKVMGFSMAWCDNDAPDGTRDNFIGSVFVPESHYNEHWKNADDFGVMKLVGLTPVNSISGTSAPAWKAWYDARGRSIQLTGLTGKSSIAVTDLTGKIRLHRMLEKGADSNIVSLDASSLPPGIFILTINAANGLKSQKISIY
jgi:hypothetical protein